MFFFAPFSLFRCSSLFGFQRLREDGARTKALLVKVKLYKCKKKRPGCSVRYGRRLSCLYGGEESELLAPGGGGAGRLVSEGLLATFSLALASYGEERFKHTHNKPKKERQGPRWFTEEGGRRRPSGSTLFKSTPFNGGARREPRGVYVRSSG